MARHLRTGVQIAGTLHCLLGATTGNSAERNSPARTKLLRAASGVLHGAADLLHHGEVQVILQPQHQEYGVPDFQVQQGHAIVGWAEAKTLGGTLNHNTKQIRQYRSALHNLIFTNFLTFRLFIHGELHGEVELTGSTEGVATAIAVAALSELLNLFFQESIPAVESASQLADVLALRARFLRLAVANGLTLAPVQALRNAYTQYLFPGISDEDFADLVAQTIVYTLFAAWSQADAGQFTLATAAAQLPPNIPLLQNLFALTVSNPALANTPIGLQVGGVAGLLAATNPNVLLSSPDETVQADVGQDPVMYFYQPFLHAYSERTAKARGVYYTPIPAVAAIVRIANSITTEVYDRELGLAGPNVFVLDPATGTGTFLVQVGRQIVNNINAAGDSDLLTQYLEQRFANNTFGFEFLAAPYTIAHLKLARFLHNECGLPHGERFKVYLTNTLQTPQFAAPALPLLEALAEENQAAANIKTAQPLLVILGNPPWSGHSENLHVNLNGMDAVEPFKWCDGRRVDQTKWVNNDYVKFIRWSQWRLTESEHISGDARNGVVVLITDNSYLTSPSFRGMRRHLLTQFDRIHIINLHGNIRSGAVGAADQNVFDILQGVCIGVFIRGGQAGHEQAQAQPETHEAAPHSAFLSFALPTSDDEAPPNDALHALSSAPIRASLTYTSCGPGTRAMKYGWLNGLTWQDSQAGELLTPQAPFYFFAPFETDSEYSSWPSVTDCLPFFNMCVTTGDDEARVFLSEAELRSCSPDASNIREYLYRPFDLRRIDFSTDQLARARVEMMEQFYRPNVGLLVVGQTRRRAAYDYSFVTTTITDKSCLSTEANCSVFPLRRYLTPEFQAALPVDGAPSGQPIQVSNVRPELLGELAHSYGVSVTDEQVFYYIYAVLNSEGYLSRYEQQLRVEFPHIPFARQRRHFEAMAIAGRGLADAQLGIGVAASHFPFSAAGNSRIDFTSALFIDQQGIQINGTGAIFGGITPEMWNYRVGANQPLRDWLRSRNGHSLVLEVTSPAEQVSIDEYRTIARKIAAAIPAHAAIDDAWSTMTHDIG